jgi:hypothetical protein
MAGDDEGTGRNQAHSPECRADDNGRAQRAASGHRGDVRKTDPRRSKRRRVVPLRGTATLAQDPPAFPLGETAPDAVLLAHGKRVLEAGLAHRALHTDGLRSRGILFLSGVEDLGVDPAARSELSPAAGYRKSL